MEVKIINDGVLTCFLPVCTDLRRCEAKNPFGIDVVKARESGSLADAVF